MDPIVEADDLGDIGASSMSRNVIGAVKGCYFGSFCYALQVYVYPIGSSPNRDNLVIRFLGDHFSEGSFGSFP